MRDRDFFVEALEKLREHMDECLPFKVICYWCETKGAFESHVKAENAGWRYIEHLRSKRYSGRMHIAECPECVRRDHHTRKPRS